MEHRPLRLVVRGRVGPGRLDQLRQLALAAELDRIALYLNFDMVGSPNFVRFVYDGSGDIGPTGPAGSAEIEDVFNSYFAANGLATEPTAFDGRSDYQAFINNLIPAGGLFTGERDQDGGAGGDLRRHGRCSLRPVLPPGLRHVREQQQCRARPDVGRDRPRHDHLRPEHVARERRTGQGQLQHARQDQRTGDPVGTRSTSGRG